VCAAKILPCVLHFLHHLYVCVSWANPSLWRRRRRRRQGSRWHVWSQQHTTTDGGVAIVGISSQRQVNCLPIWTEATPGANRVRCSRSPFCNLNFVWKIPSDRDSSSCSLHRLLLHLSNVNTLSLILGEITWACLWKYSPVCARWFSHRMELSWSDPAYRRLSLLSHALTLIQSQHIIGVYDLPCIASMILYSFLIVVHPPVICQRLLKEDTF
jgi:hypothetical protein